MGQFLPEEDVYVTICTLPVHVKGLLKEVRGCQIILINELLSDDAKAKTFRHELRHLRRNDMRRQRPIEEIEREADQ